MWNKGSDSFKADPPNATLSVLKKDGANNIVVELTSVDQKSDTVVFKLTVLEGSIAGHFKATSLYIDFVTFGVGYAAASHPRPNTITPSRI